MKHHQQATTTCFAIRTELQRTAACREGFTILEVLISAGIMVGGLACVASLLPAAAQRMSQAVSEDRAGTLAANAYADITARRSLGLLCRSQLASNYGVIPIGIVVRYSHLEWSRPVGQSRSSPR